MKDIVGQLEGSDLERCRRMEAEMMALQSGSLNIELAEGADLVQKHDKMWRELRERFDLEREEEYALDRQTGAIFVMPME